MAKTTKSKIPVNRARKIGAAAVKAERPANHGEPIYRENAEHGTAENRTVPEAK